MVQLTSVTEQTPPPSCPAEFPVIRQFFAVLLEVPPPSVSEKLPATMQFFKVELAAPPPLMICPKPGIPKALLFLIRQLINVVPIAPPPPKAAVLPTIVQLATMLPVKPFIAPDRKSTRLNSSH